MIPRLLHRVWFGNAPVPQRFEGFWASWAALSPGWELKTWHERDLGWLKNRRLLAGCKNHSERSDVARFEIMARYGGCYVDVDVEPLRQLDPLLDSETPIAGWEFSHRLGTAVLLSPPGHPAFAEVVKRMPDWVRDHDDETSEKRTGPVFFTAAWWKRTDVQRLPREAFYPVGWFEKEKLGGPYPEDSWAVHHWSGSWLDA